MGQQWLSCGRLLKLQAGDTLRLLVPAVNSTRDFGNAAAIRSFCDTLVPPDRPAARSALSTALFDALCDREMLARKLGL